jgi:hypothetical protein
MEIQIIALEKDKEICDKSIILLENENFDNVKHFKAIVGNDLIPFWNNKNYKDYDHPYISVSMDAYYSLLNGRKQHKDLSSKGALGCYLSHVMLWKELVEREDLNYMVIFEDDIVTVPSLKYANIYDEMISLLEEINYDFDIFLLGYILRDNKYLTEISNRIGKTSFFWCLHSYVISKKGAKKLLEKIFPIEMQIDSYISYYSYFNKDFNIYYSKRILFKQSSKRKTNIQDECFVCMINDYYDKNNNSNDFTNFLIGVIVLIIIIFISLFIFMIYKMKNLICK